MLKSRCRRQWISALALAALLLAVGLSWPNGTASSQTHPPKLERDTLTLGAHQVLKRELAAPHDGPFLPSVITEDPLYKQLVGLLILLLFAWSFREGWKKAPRKSAQWLHVMEHLEPTSVEFVISIPEEDVRIKVTHYHEVGIEGGEWTRSVVQQAAELFVEWAHKKDFELSAKGRRRPDLWVVDISLQLLNEWDAEWRGLRDVGQLTVLGLHYSGLIKEAEIIFVGVYESQSPFLRSGIVAHELAHFLLDYFRIYDNYYKLENGKTDREGPAEEFERYFGFRQGQKRMETTRNLIFSYLLSGWRPPLDPNQRPSA